MELNLNRLDWNHLRAFLTTAEEQTLSGAARRLGLTQPTLSRQIAALEDHLGLVLFERVGRGLQITESGTELLVHARDMGLAAERMSLTASGQRSDLTGWVRVTASDVMSAHMMPQVVTELRKVAPQLRVDVIATNDIQDLMRREADIAIRHMRPEEPELVARLVTEATGHFYATSAYLDRMGRPDTKADLGRYDWISYGDIDRMIEYLGPMGIALTPDQFRVGSADGLVAWEMTKAGLGICPMDSAVGDKVPELERVLPDDIHVKFPIWLVAHRELHTSPKIRLVFDLLAKLLVAR